MLNNNFKVIGVMSGTSLDGLDFAYIHFHRKNESWDFKILKAETFGYDDKWRSKLNNAFLFNKEELDVLNKEYTSFLATQIKLFIAKNEIQDIDAICSHGHTILHEPEEGFTLQIGNLPEIALLLKETVVCDFRVQDVQLGGQGAPLVPIGDELLFSNYSYCLNLGGFSNISFNEKGKRIAFDISPVNIVLNHYTESVGYHYDDKGKFAKSGVVNKQLLEELNALDFYKKSFPKSLGKEFIQKEILPLISKYEISVNDILRTFVEHIAIQITNVVTSNTSVLVTGGGAYNVFLIERLRFFKSNVDWVIPNDDLIQFKEALLFGFLGILRLRNEVNVLSSVTGASKNHSSGIVYNYP
ncbi:anhydro-N-acetylmuramic acid kinase [Flavobacterium okayamense]|uniref:Anhydro-N-acetylmuramic acid kinase n=1 Tax=Flavobacterium okayamense TaxID=2830782 RepID=A0ABN6HWS2_9FLAO|nr:anhydro-N-acetylmuramic acid kinase [Flavobacterium okayamense]BCY28235.1 anhydro-N-acetylmuramic acid kinase [Flavobacterium okayamense]